MSSVIDLSVVFTMSLTFSKDDVRRHLRDLGYKDVGDEHLEEFVRDLRRLIRHEDRAKRRRQHQVDQSRAVRSASSPRSIQSSSSASSSAYGSSESLRQDEEEQDEEMSPKRLLHQPGRGSRPSRTVARSSNDLRAARKVADLKRRDRRRSGANREREEESIVASSSASTEAELMLRVREVEEEDDRPPRRTRSINRFAGARPTTSFIRPPATDAGPAAPSSSSGGPQRMDPVRLYQFYQGLWSKTKFPGDESSKGMRWAVREWMMGPPEEQQQSKKRKPKMEF